MTVAGHKYNLTKGVDYHEVFAAAPNQNTIPRYRLIRI